MGQLFEWSEPVRERDDLDTVVLTDFFIASTPEPIDRRVKKVSFLIPLSYRRPSLLERSVVSQSASRVLETARKLGLTRVGLKFKSNVSQACIKD